MPPQEEQTEPSKVDELKHEQVRAAEDTLPDTAPSISEGASAAVNIYLPLEVAEGAQPETRIVVTIRSVVVGCILGSLVNASNLYLGE